MDAFSIDAALDTLVDQFAEPLAFFRELVQNAIDAGSPEVDIWLELIPRPGQAEELMVIHVDDIGEGMDLAVIDDKLTRLFSSSKEEDFTKIGRFGIGFVSVFAIAPEVVCVDTARAGEAWRVLFHEDRTFERIALAAPLEGTQVRICKSMDEVAYRVFERRAREVITFWCRHASAEVRFQGAVLNEPLRVAGPCQVRHHEEGTEVVAGFCDQSAGRYGFYNQGLTLLEGPTPESHKTFHPFVAFKVSSRYLEHTLTRANVLRDINFDKALAIVERLVTDALPERLMTSLASDAGDRETRATLYATAARWLEAQQRMGLDDRVSPAVTRLGAHEIFRSPCGKPIRLDACIKAETDGRLYFEPASSELVTRMEQAGHVVVAAELDTPVYAALVEIRGKRPPRANEAFCTAVAPDAGDDGASQALVQSVERLLLDQGARVKGVCLGHLAYPGSSIGDRIAITQETFGELTPCSEVGDLGTSFFSWRRVVVLNVDHPTIEGLVRLAPTEQELAAYLTAKLFFLRSALSPELDATLASIAVNHRCHRLSR